jgi:hypothetical protein
MRNQMDSRVLTSDGAWPDLAALMLGLCCLSLMACNDDDAPSEAIVPSADAALVFEGPLRDLSGVDPMAAQSLLVGVGDVGRDGNRLVVPAAVTFQAGTVWQDPPSNCSDCFATAGSAGGGTSRFLVTSDDLGRTFSAPRTLSWPTWMGQFLLGVHVEGNRLTWMGRGSEAGVIANTTDEYHTLREANLIGERANFANNDALDEQRFYARLRNFGTHIGGVEVFIDPRIVDRSRGTLTLVRYVPGERVEQTILETQAEGWPCIPNSFASADGSSYYGVCPTGSYDRFCRITITREGRSLVECSPSEFWPPELSEGEAMAGPQGVWVGAIENGYAVLATLPDVERMPTIYTLGPADAFYPTWAGSTSRFAGFFAFRKGGEPWRLADIRSDGVVEEIVVPANPCKNGASCGSEADLRFLLPLGDDEFLGFYVVNARSYPSSHEFVYALRFRAERRLMPTPPDGERPMVPGIPTARVAGPMVKACLAARSCGLEVSWLGGCMAWWDRFGPDSPQLQNFLQASSQGCEALRATWPGGNLAMTDANCRPGCHDNVYTMCAAGTPRMQFIDCNLYGSTCDPNVGCVDGSNMSPCRGCTSQGSYTECFGETVKFAFSCTSQRLVCNEASAVFGEPCTPEETCTASRCEDGIAWQCWEQGRYILRKCALKGQDCWHEGDEVGCTPGPVTPGCNDGSTAARCIGTAAAFCESGVIQVADCQELGFSRCAIDAQGLAICE